MRIWLFAAVLLAIAGVAVLAASITTTSRGALLGQLQRPATQVGARVQPAPVTAIRRAGPYRVAFRLSPNLASLHNRLSLLITSRGRPLTGARVAVDFSMPAMNMWRALTGRLAAGGNGTYATDLPVLGMPGVWQLRIQIVHGAAPVSFVLSDRMRS